MDKILHGSRAPLGSMLRASNLVYLYADLRSIVLKYGKAFQEEKPELVTFDQPDLIVTKKSSGQIFESTLMKHAVTADNILKFVDLNRKYLNYDKKADKISFDKTETSENTRFQFEDSLTVLKDNYDAEIIEFDDSHSNQGISSELLYAIVVNRTEKHITVVFRGSDNLRDWIQNVKANLKTPKPIKEFGSDVEIHRGFANYLFLRSIERGDETQTNTKYELITKVLKEVFNYKKDGKDYSDYSLFVTGHSLGGALAQILAFTLAGSETGKLILPSNKPVTALTYASPECGIESYRNAFNQLEKDNKLRHLRVSNHGDAVPNLISSTFRWSDWTQPGVNIHLHSDKKADIGYNASVRYWFNPFQIQQKHSPLEYRRNLLEKKLNDDILEKSIEDFYDEYAFK